MNTIYNQESYRLKLIDELESLRKTISLLKIQISAVQVSDRLLNLNNQHDELSDSKFDIITTKIPLEKNSGK
uniref:Uncharacterized protein n=1 Tax=viral metagenome TaxID=1070528 RepID=A0A6C0AZT7_9ZZZZ|tara:strand:- start:2685 stop:2900 length:216 start_codon:yes stop_codon:yes gene_type:complete